MFGREFSGWYLEFEVFGLEPDFVSNFPRFKMGEGLFLHMLLDEFVGHFGFLLCILNLTELLLKSWKEGFSEEWVGPEFISHDQGEGEFASD